MSRLYPGAGRQRATRALLWGITLGVLLANAAAGVPLVCEPLAHPAEVHGQVVVWGWNIASASLSKLVPSFNAIYPGVCVDVSMTGTNLQSRFLLSLSAGVGAPDVSQLEC